jgi:hypothetical protein
MTARQPDAPARYIASTLVGVLTHQATTRVLGRSHRTGIAAAVVAFVVHEALDAPVLSVVSGLI